MEIIKLIKIFILGMLWMIQTVVGDTLYPIFNKAYKKRQWAIVAIVGLTMIPFVIINTITTPWLERNTGH